MSAQVDVLAVLDDIAENVKGIHATSQRTGEAFGRDLNNARAVVADLIHALHRVELRAVGHPDDTPEDHKRDLLHCRSIAHAALANLGPTP